MSMVFENEKKIRLGIWGLGRGRAFIEQCKELNFEIAAGCDLNQIMCDDFRKLCPDAFITCDEDEFLKQDLDVVLVATFFTNHAKDSIKVLQAGKHVISEVSAFFTAADGVALVDAVEQSGKLYCLAENFTNQFIKKLWQEGVFGELSYAEFDYVHECRGLGYSYLYGDPIHPGNIAHSWRSWLNFHYYCTHSLGAAMETTGTRPVKVIAPDGCITLPGYLPASENGSMKPSFVVMDNGGVIRNLMGGSTADSHACRIWGTKAFADLSETNPTVQLGQAGKGLKIKLTPQEDELTKLAAKAGHGGGDFWMLYNFANTFYNGVPLYWDIYHACDVTLTGIMAVKSQYSGGIPVEVPDFRDKAVREKYRNDHFAQEHLDPKKIFPEDQDVKETRRFSLIMNDLGHPWKTNGIPLLISALEGIKLYPFIADLESRLAVQNQVRQLLRSMNVIVDAINAARHLAEKYPDSQAGGALRSFIDSAPEKINDPKALREELLNWLLYVDLPDLRQLRMYLDARKINESTVPPVPEEFILRTFREGDEEQYIKLMHLSGFEQWDLELLKKIREGALDEGIFFLEEKSSGRLVATTMANRIRPGEEELGGELGWVGVDPEFRGQRLSAIVCSAVQKRFSQEGYKRLFLRTDDFRLPAVKTYLQLGWMPQTDTPDMKRRWDKVCKKLNMSLPEENSDPAALKAANNIFTKN